ncbi:hypothetical protein DEO72_LG8g2084 [Vigna unguiculata]|uniref:Transposase n=1 Tax=Vigna unguiculata TaxID=3917 RepID=A0A4D6MTW3_VIGUN|nr:hypothetical protein DEO72_LG8g2084 [Vigna unguiculata]
MSSSSSVSSSSSSESTELDRSKDGLLGREGTSSGVVTSGMPMEVVREVREDPPEELEESNRPAKGGYGWVAADVRDQSSLFRWSRLLNSWLNCTPVMSRGVSGDIVSLRDQSSLFRWSRLLNSWLNCTPVMSRGVSGDIVSLERVSAVDRVCHGQERATEKFFYISSSVSSSSSSESTELDRSKDGLLGREGTSSGVVTSGMPMEVVREVREDPPEELEESNRPAKGGYGWVAADVRDQSSLFRWSRLLNSWLNCTPVMSRGVSGDIVSLERVSVVDRVCHGQEGATEKFFYMYMCHFSQLHVRLPLDDFTMGVLRALNVAPTQLHPNSWAYLQAFRILYGYFKVVVKEGGKSHFLNADGSAKFPFSWTNNPSRYKDMGMEELSAGDKEVVGMLLKFVDKLPTKGLVRVYNSVHPIIDIEGHMAQSGMKNLVLFQSLRKEMAAKAKAAGKADVPNLQESVVEVHVHGGTKRKAKLPPRPGKGKDVKKIRAALLGTASGAGSASGEKLPEAGLIELPEISSLEARP